MANPQATVAPEATNPNNITEKNRHLFTPTEKQDRCLITEVRNLLLNNGLVQLVPNFDNDQRIIDGRNLPTEGQRFLLSRFWNVQLMADPIKSQETRYYLTDTTSPQHWIDVFRLKVIPLCLELNLPRPPTWGNHTQAQLH